MLVSEWGRRRSMEQCLPFCGVFHFLLALVLCSSAVYVFHGNPYSFSDPLQSGVHTLRKHTKGIPYHTMLFYPLESGVYPVVYFIGGLNGLAPVEVYTDVARRISAHGLIIAGVDPDWPALNEHTAPLHYFKREQKQASIEEVVATFKWLKTNLNTELDSVLPPNVTVQGDWSRTGGLCHSAGCDSILKMAVDYTTTTNFSAIAWLEPFSADIPKLPPPVSGGAQSIPSLMHGTQWCEEKPNCCVRGVDYISLYEKWLCPRVLINITDFGHCDILNPLYYDGCVVTHFCKTGENNRTAYRNYMQGLVSAFFSSTLQDNWNEMIKYVTEQTLIPLPLGNLTVDVGCHTG